MKPVHNHRFAILRAMLRKWNVRFQFNSAREGVNYYAPDRTWRVVYERLTPEIVVEEIFDGKYLGYYAGIIHVARPMSAARKRRLEKKAAASKRP